MGSLIFCWIAGVAFPGFSVAGSAVLILSGFYEWNYEKVKRDVNARLEANGKNTWQVMFSFGIGSKNYQFEGSLEGDLSQTLIGQVQDESRKRTWRLKLEFLKEHYLGTHTELNEDSEDETGWIWLYPKTE